MRLHEGGGLILRQIADNGYDRLIGKILSRMELLDIRRRNLAERFLTAVGRPAVRVPMENQLVESLQRDMAGIVFIACYFTDDLGTHPLELLLVKGGVHEDIRKQRDSEICILLEHPHGHGSEVLRSLRRERPADKIDLFGDLFRTARRCALIEQTGDEIGQPGFVRGVLRRSDFDEGMYFHGRQVMLLQEQHRDSVRRHEAHRIYIGRPAWPHKRDDHAEEQERRTDWRHAVR